MESVPTPSGKRAQMLVLFFLLLLTPLSAQSVEYEGRRLAAVRLEPEETILHHSELQERLQPLRVGESLRMADVRLVVERLYETGRFEDIVADAQLQGDDVLLTLQLTPAHFVRDVVVEGVPEPPNQGQLVNATKLQLGQPYSPPQVRQSVESLLEILRANGFYLATVKPEISFAPVQQVDIKFHVNAGERARYSQPQMSGNPNRPVEDIVDASRWRKLYGLLGWKQATDSRTSQGLDRIRRLYQKRNYLLSRVTLEQMQFVQAQNHVVPVINVDSGPEVLVRAAGAKISRGKLRELVPIYQELTVDRDLLLEGQRELTEHMQARGYFDASINFEIQNVNPKQQVIQYNIDAGEQHKLVFLDIRGNRYFSSHTIRERLYTTAATFLRFRRGRFSEDFLRRDLNAIRELYRSNGFRDVEVSATTEDDYKGKENEEAVFIEIKEGPQWFVSELTISGVESLQAEDLRTLLSSTEGQPYSDLSIATDRDAVLNYFFNNGYPDASFEVAATPGAKAQVVSLKYTVQPGKRQYVRDVLLNELSSTDLELVRSRIRNLQPGDPLSQSSMIENQRRLYDLGIFARVDQALQNPEGDTDHKYVLYRFEEARKWSVNGGFGAQIARIGRGSPTTFDAPAGAAGFSPRLSFGVSRSNLLGLGHTIGFQGRLSNIQRRSLMSYVAPQFKGNENLSLTFTTLYDDSRDVQTFNSKRQEGSIQLSQRLSKANTVQYRVTYRRVTASNIKITPALVPLLSQPVQLGIVSGTFIQDRRDDPTDPRRGVWNTVDGGVAANFFGSKTSFNRVVARNATYHRIGRDLVFARSTQIGIIDRLSQVDVPLPERFFAGGAVSHRGFPENQAGPRDLLTGFPVGGEALLVNSHELRFPLLGENIGGVFFHDAGNVYSSLTDVSLRFHQRDLQDFNYMVHAIGFGVRYRTPVGPIRIDFAYSVNSPRFMGLQGTAEQLLDPNQGGVRVEQRINQFQFHFSLGQLF